MSLAEEAHYDWRPKFSSDEFLKSRQIYEEPVAEVSAYQLNGDLTDDAQSHGPRQYYMKPKAKGLSRQLNGNVSSDKKLEIFLAARSPDEMSEGSSAMANEEASRGGDPRKTSRSTKLLRTT